MLTCYTIGYGNRNLGEFTRLLKENMISRIVDVRSYPHSEREDFNAESLAEALPKEEIMYVHYPRLGGLRKIAYQEFMKSEDFKTALEGLFELIRNSEKDETAIAIMCAEKNPRNCHRRFVAEALEKKGVRVVHIIEAKQTPLFF